MSNKHVSLYRKWRSQSLPEIIGQEFAVKTLTNALTNGKIAHAYLFSGPRGTGKTSLARILAKSVNCLKNGISVNPCQECESCKSITDGTSLDVMEIDAASNRGVDDIRQLRERVKFTPVKSRYKVYIIDEVHMLTGEAFNALLKTLEEPPEHVIFIMATTEPHKIPITILSRVMRFDLKRIPTEQQITLLRKISDSEGIDITDLALHKLAVQSNGSLRDSESMLDQITSFSTGKIDENEVSSLLGIMSEEFLSNLLSEISKGNARESIELIRDSYKNGKDPGQIVNDFLIFVHVMILKKIGVSTKELVSEYAISEDIIDKTSDFVEFTKLRDLETSLRETSASMKYAFSPLATLEMAVMDLIDMVSPRSKSQSVSHNIEKPAAVKAEGKREKQPEQVIEEDTKKDIQQSEPMQGGSFSENLKNLTKRREIIMYAFLSRAVSIEMDDGVLKIVLPSNAEFEKNRLLESETQKKIKTITTELGVELKSIDVTLEDIGDIKQDKDVKSAAELFGAKIKE